MISLWISKKYPIKLRTFAFATNVLLIYGTFSTASFSQQVAGQPFECLSAQTWQREQDFQKPQDDEQAFRQGPFAFPKLLDDSSTINFFTSQDFKSKELKIAITQGIKALHAFDDIAAEQNFRFATQKDPQCFAAWMGLIIANEKYPDRAGYFLEKAEPLSAKNSRKQAWIAAYKTFFQTIKDRDLTERLSRLAGDLHAIEKQFPEDQMNAQTFAIRYRILASHLSNVSLDLSKEASQLQKLIASPSNAYLLPYSILTQNKLSQEIAIAQAKLMPKSSKSPSLSRLAAEPFLSTGDFNAAIPLLEKSLKTSPDFRDVLLASKKEQQARFQNAVTLAWTFYHAGQIDQAQKLADNLLLSPRKPTFTGLEAIDDEPQESFLQARLLKAQLHMASEEWDEISALFENAHEDASLLARAQACYFQSLASAAKSSTSAATTQREALRKLSEEAARTPYLNRHAADLAKMVRGSEAWAALCNRRVTPFFKDIVDVPTETLATRLSKTNVPDLGISLLEEALKTSPGSQPLLKKLGKFQSNSDTFATTSKNVNEMQTSPQAPDFKLTDKSGTAYSLKQFKGKPVLVIFFLGRGCPHCVEQLQKFKPQVGAFSEAGIPIVTISTDPNDVLTKKLGDSQDLDPELPFLILSDSALIAFKAWGCHDDFLNRPLHGTFLLHPDGHVLWSDLSHDPYTQASFLLGECKRLLNVSPQKAVAIDP